jgi:glycosyltransferase involved in cell wall biosynthesis
MPTADASGAEGRKLRSGATSLSPNGVTADILFDARWDGPHGIARVGRELLKRLPGAVPLRAGLRLFHPLDPVWTSLQISRLAPRVFFSPGFNPPLFSQRPFVFTIHDLNYVHCPENGSVSRRAYFELLVRPATRRAARVLTVSEFSRRQIIEWSGVADDQVVNVSAGVDAAYRPEGPKHEPGYPYVLYVGNRLPHKNVPRLLEAFALSGLASELRLLLSGDPDEATLSLAKRLGIEGSLRFAGFVAEPDMPALYRGAVAHLLPSLFEGFGLPVVEAMACRVPVLTSRATSLPEIGGNAVLLVDPFQPEDIARGMREIVSDDALRQRLMNEGLVRAARFTWEKTASAVAAVLDVI